MSFLKDIYQKNIREPLTTPFGKGVYLIARSTIIAQCITLFTIPIITRLFSPSDFGIFALYSSILSISLVFASLKYEFAIPLPEKDDIALQLMTLSGILIIVICIFFGIVIGLFGSELLAILKISELQPFLAILAVSFFCAGIYQVLNYWAIRSKNYQLIGSTLITKNFSGSVGKILFGLMRVSVLGLIIGDLISQITGIYSLLTNFWKIHSTDVKKITLAKIFNTAKEYYRFPVFSLPSTFFNTLAFQLPVILLVSNYGVVSAGLFSLALHVLAYPVGFLSSSISQVYLGEIAGLLRSEPCKIRSIYQATVIRIATITIPILLFIAILAPFAFSFIFGEAWQEAGFFCIALAIMLIFQVCFSTVSILHYCGLNSWVLGFDVVRTALIFGIFSFSTFMHFSAFTAVFLYSVTMGLMYILNYGMNLQAISRLERTALR